MAYSSAQPVDLAQLSLRPPDPEDAAGIHRLVGDSPPLDGNSLYCNLLQCTHFAGTSICARQGGDIVGFISGYLIPQRQDTLFIWQVAVDSAARGRGLARRMLQQLLQRECCADVHYLETTVTPGNRASRAMFESVADLLGCHCQESLLFERERHFGGSHDSEILLRIGPFHRELIGIGSGMNGNTTETSGLNGKTS